MFGRKKPRSAADPVADTPSAEEMQTVRAVLRHYPPGARLHFGAPCRCPQCGDFGFVQNVDHVRGRATNDCRTCNTTWTITRLALRQSARQPTVANPPALRFPDVAPAGSSPTAGRPASAEPHPGRATPAGSENPEHNRLLAQLGIDATVDGPLPIGALFDDDAATEAPEAPAAGHPRHHAGAAAGSPQRPTDTPTAPAGAPPDAPSVSFTALDGEVRIDTPRAMQILVVDDNPFELMLIESLIGSRLGQEIVVTPAATRREGERRLSRQPFDLVILDLDLPDSAGIFTMLEWRHGAAGDVPVIALTQELDNGLLVQARVLGAAHVITIAQLEALAARGEAAHDRFNRLLRTTAAHIDAGDVADLLAG